MNTINTLHELDDYYEPNIIRTLDYLENLISKDLVTSHNYYKKQNSTYWKQQLFFAGLSNKYVNEFIKDAKLNAEI